MRVLVILNENPAGSHPDVYEAFEQLVEGGLVQSYDVYSPLLAKASGLDDLDISREILELARAQTPGLIVWMHTGQFRIDDKALSGLKAIRPKPVSAYWEKDAYHPFYKPIPNSMLRIMRFCDRVFVPCGGPILRALRLAGILEVRYAPSCASGTRFLPLWRADARFTHDIVMIGNRVTSTLPLRRMPGARLRECLVQAFERRFGSRFAVYGSGWRGSSAQGPCSFDEQQWVNSNARVVVGVDNLPLPFFFSNRLPTALACGAPVVHTGNLGYRRVFGSQLSNRLFDSVPRAIALTEELLEKEDRLLTKESRSNRTFFENSLATDLVARYVVRETLQQRGARGYLPWARSTTEYRNGAFWRHVPPLGKLGRIHE